MYLSILHGKQKKMDFSQLSEAIPSSGATPRKFVGGTMFLFGLLDSVWNMSFKEVGYVVTGAGFILGGAIIWIDGKWRDKKRLDFTLEQEKKEKESAQRLKEDRDKFMLEMEQKQLEFKQDMEEKKIEFEQKMQMASIEAEQTIRLDKELSETREKKILALLASDSIKNKRLEELEKDKAFLINRCNELQLQIINGDHKRHDLRNDLSGAISAVENKTVELEHKQAITEQVVKVNVKNVKTVAKEGGVDIIKPPGLDDSDEFPQVETPTS